MRTNHHPGTFIVLDGADGCGTTTQGKQLATRLRAEGYQVTLTAEPSTGPIGKLIRKYLGGGLPKPDGEMLKAMMTLLFSADRIEHLAFEVEKLLRRGHIVICDRYVLSTFAYQTDALDEFHWIAQVSQKALTPDVTVIVEVTPEVGMARCDDRGGRKEIYECLEVQERVSDNYRRLRNFPHGVVLTLDGEGDPDEITDQLLELVRPHIKELR
jgi:dTMP kinase